MHTFIYENDPYYSTSTELITKKLELLQLKDGDHLVDLGCGHCEALISASSIADITCEGYEILPEVVEKANNDITNANLINKIQVHQKDFIEADLSKTTALIIYLTRSGLGHLSLKLENELPKGARIVTHQFDIPAWEAEEKIEFILSNGAVEMIYIYKQK